MEKSGISNATIVALIVGLVLGFAGGAYWYKGKMAKEVKKDVMVEDKDKILPSTPSTSVKDVMEENDPVVSTVVDTNIVAAPNQSAGGTVLVNKVTSNTEIWVAVREDKNGIMGNVLGAKKVAAGTSENVIVQLLRATVPGSKYYIVLFKDNGNGVFDSKMDTLIESDGRVVVSTFRTQ